MTKFSTTPPLKSRREALSISGYWQSTILTTFEDSRQSRYVRQYFDEINLDNSLTTRPLNSYWLALSNDNWRDTTINNFEEIWGWQSRYARQYYDNDDKDNHYAGASFEACWRVRQYLLIINIKPHYAPGRCIFHIFFQDTITQASQAFQALFSLVMIGKCNLSLKTYQILYYGNVGIWLLDKDFE